MQVRVEFLVGNKDTPLEVVKNIHRNGEKQLKQLDERFLLLFFLKGVGENGDESVLCFFFKEYIYITYIRLYRISS